ncbi:PsiF family protein [Derxia lacustris]|uniref:PsiF family protein n=1 Tax=Derxia lacustris TaxID=764842 RepID=UPI000A171A2B|nr:PsiF family protein [Derxia lacustris]
MSKFQRAARSTVVVLGLSLAAISAAHAADADDVKPAKEHSRLYECSRNADKKGLKDDARKTYIKDCVATKAEQQEKSKAKAQ